MEACRAESVLGSQAGGRVRLKWPNDLYAIVGSPAEEANTGDVRKIGGVLVNASFSSGHVDVVIGMFCFFSLDRSFDTFHLYVYLFIGCGLNVLNLPPITSLAQLESAAHTNLSIEHTAASVISKFESMWSTFIHGRGSFEPFMELYLKRWIHTFVFFYLALGDLFYFILFDRDQLVTLTTTIPHRQVRIVGITEDHGLLRTIPERNGFGSMVEYIDLQPDGNSFDLMANLIKSKT